MLGIRVCSLTRTEEGIRLMPVFCHGYRCFNSPVWRAVCLPLYGELLKHEAPNENCKCGLYSSSFGKVRFVTGKDIHRITFMYSDKNYHSITDRCNEIAVVIVECLGKTIKHELGNAIVYRSEIQIPQKIILSAYIADRAQEDLEQAYQCEVTSINIGDVFTFGNS